MSLLDVVYATPWAIRPESLVGIIAIAERQDISPELLAGLMHHAPARQAEAVELVSTRKGAPIDRTDTVTRRGSTAVVPIVGPIVRYASVFSSLSGGTSVETIARDLRAVLDDATVTSVLLNIDSPGGEASGIAELGDMIYAARGSKPIWAYVSDLGASAGYWLASAAEEIIVAETAALGSIGVVMAVRDPAAQKSRDIQFVSSVSPHKRPDPTTQAGREQLQGFVDTLGTIFVDAVARNRDTTAEHVLEHYGAGGLLVGREAVASGLADRLGSFEATLSELAEATSAPPRLARPAAAALDPLPTRTAIVADVEPRRSRMSSFRDSFMAMFDRAVADGALVDASADQETRIVSEHLDQRPIDVDPTPVAARPSVATVTPTQPPVAASDDATRRELDALKAENRRLRNERIAQAAGTFADRQFSDMKALAPELPLISALMAQAMSDDESYGPIYGADGTRSTRQTLLESTLAARQSRKDLLTELHNPGMLAVLAQADKTRSAAAAMPSDDRQAELLGMTPLGQAALDEQRRGR